MARALRRRRKRPANQLALWNEPDAPPPFWQRRFYDFNVWSEKKKAEKLNYMHSNPVTRGLVRSAKQWLWSSYSFYFGRRDARLRIDPV